MDLSLAGLVRPAAGAGSTVHRDRYGLHAETVLRNAASFGARGTPDQLAAGPPALHTVGEQERFVERPQLDGVQAAHRAAEALRSDDGRLLRQGTCLFAL